MAVIRPLIFTSIEDAEVSRNRPVSEEVVRKMIQNSNMLAALAPIGTIRCIAINQPGAPNPSTDIFQLADGGQITHPQSPITSVGPSLRYTPDFRNIYLRGAADDVSNNIGGSPFTNVRHTHDTSFVNHGGAAYGEQNDEIAAYLLGHSHGVNNDLNSEEPLEPAHQEIAVYLKIN